MGDVVGIGADRAGAGVMYDYYWRGQLSVYRAVKAMSDQFEFADPMVREDFENCVGSCYQDLSSRGIWLKDRFCLPKWVVWVAAGVGVWMVLKGRRE